ncbi:UDP binding domain-containing protein [Brevibacillus sp. H7]|uniref:UDP binding domain-containing protein n=1 Tax=Brevibacillus sp. H7 TaxID=3349138 RepID=UPI00382430A7
MSTRNLTLLSLCPPARCQDELVGLGFSLAGHPSPQDVPGAVVTAPEDVKRLVALQPKPSAEPGLMLVYGQHVPYGLAEKMKAVWQAPQWEVVRLFLLAGGERALIGGDPDSTWIPRLRRQLAEREVISLICRMGEVDETVRQLPLYLAWKERFYLQLGRRCDDTGVRLEVVSCALGMDKRIGQGWLTAERGEESPIAEWLAEECSTLVEKANVCRIALWGSEHFWRQVTQDWTSGKEVRLYDPAGKGKPNKPHSRWQVFGSWEETLEGADLLVIGETDERLKEIALPEIVNRMHQPFVIDACACFPLQEAEAFSLSYRTLGQNTNVWEWNGL